MTTPTTTPQALEAPAAATDAGRHIPALDGLRGLAILPVMFYHAFEYAGGLEQAQCAFPDLPVLIVASIGWAGVDLFFVLSGFLITGILLEARDHEDYFRNFYARRVVRIFPLYYAVVAFRLLLLPNLQFAAAQDLITHPIGTVEALSYWFYLSNFWQAFAPVGERHDIILGLTWSLAIEEQYYLVWPLLVLLLSRRILLRVCAGMVVFSICLRLVVVLIGGSDLWPLYFITPCRWDGLAIGSAIALLFRTADGPERVQRLARLALALTLGVVAGVALFGRFVLHMEGLLGTLLAYTILDVLFGAALIAAVTSARPRFWTMPWLRACGKYSYAMYLFHSPVTFLAHRFFYAAEETAGLRRALDVGSCLPLLFVYFLCAAAVTFGLAWLSWQLFEKHFLKLKRFFPT